MNEWMNDWMLNEWQLWYEIFGSPSPPSIGVVEGWQGVPKHTYRVRVLAFSRRLTNEIIIYSASLSLVMSPLSRHFRYLSIRTKPHPSIGRCDLILATVLPFQPHACTHACTHAKREQKCQSFLSSLLLRDREALGRLKKKSPIIARQSIDLRVV